MRARNGILAWIAEDLDPWLRRKMGADLFSAVAVKYDSRWWTFWPRPSQPARRR